MLVKEGIEIIQQITRNNRKIPIIAISGGYSKHSESYLHASKKLGANEIPGKPFGTEQLIDTIGLYVK